MTQEQIDKLIKMNQNLLLILGYGSSIVLDLLHHDLIPKTQQAQLSWFIEAIENTVYLDKPLPRMP